MIASTLDLNSEQSRAFAHGLTALAQTDGIHAAETMLIQDFYGGPDFSELIVAPFDAAAAGQLLASDELKRAFLQTCVFLAYADGSYSAAERAKVAAFAEAMGLTGDALKTLEQSVADQLLQEIALIENVDALGEVARELKR